MSDNFLRPSSHFQKRFKEIFLRVLKVEAVSMEFKASAGTQKYMFTFRQPERGIQS